MQKIRLLTVIWIAFWLSLNALPALASSHEALFKSMLRWPGTLYKENYGRLFIETEIGFRFGKDITEPVADIESLKKSETAAFPNNYGPRIR